MLVAARPGLAAAPLAAQDASGLMARRLAAYKASLALLGAGRQETGGSGGGDEVGAGGEGRLLEERKAAALVSVLEAELGGITSAPDLTEVGAAAIDPWPVSKLNALGALFSVSQLLAQHLIYLQRCERWANPPTSLACPPCLSPTVTALAPAAVPDHRKGAGGF